MAETPTRFFKFIRPPFNLNLSIPRSFLPYLNGERWSKATLRRGGHKWPVDITDGGCFSGDGWRKCVMENGVKEFDFMVFEYKGNMVFDFLVFDPSSCEKQYLNPSAEFDVEEPLTESESESESEEEKGQLGDDRCFVSRITSYYMRSSRIANVPKEFARLNGLITKRISRQVIIRDETRRTWPATLSKTLHNKYMQIHLSVCREFRIKNHLKTGDTCMFELDKCGEDLVFNFNNIGKKSIKNYTRVKETNSTIKKATRVKETNLTIKKATRVMETNSTIEKATRVKETNSTIKKATRVKETNSTIKKATRVKETNSTIKKATRSTSNNHPYFTSTLKPCSFTRSIMYLPIDFVRSNGLDIGKMILRDDKSRSWEVLLREMGGRCFYLGCGFKAFRVANKLKKGDAFKLELVENQKNMPPVVNFSCTKRQR